MSCQCSKEKQLSRTFGTSHVLLQTSAQNLQIQMQFVLIEAEHFLLHMFNVLLTNGRKDKEKRILFLCIKKKHFLKVGRTISCTVISPHQYCFSVGKSVCIVFIVTSQLAECVCFTKGIHDRSLQCITASYHVHMQQNRYITCSS